MENCLFVANLPQSLNNYELTIALYLVFSRYGKVSIVKASRDTAQRPFGFIEFSSFASCREAIDDNEGSGIVIGGRKVRLEIARNTCKLYIEFPENQALESFSSLVAISPKFKPIPIPNTNAFILKLDSNVDNQSVISQLRLKHPNWIIQVRSDQGPCDKINNSVAESAQRQSGLFQLRIPDSGVLPVAPSTLAKIHSFSPCLQYSVTPIQSNCFPLQIPQILSRLYEDWHVDGHEESFQDPTAAREAANKLTPPLGDWDGDVFLGRLDNQKVTIPKLLEMTQDYGQVSFLRLCNRSIIREDGVPVDSTSFVRFEEGSSAKKFIETVNGSTWLGRIVKCEKCWCTSTRGPTPPISTIINKNE